MKNSSSKVSNQEISNYYDQFSKRLLKGYVTGNPRLDHAIAFAAAQIPDWSSNLLEIGCGIGETTARIRQQHAHLKVVGVDISAENIRLAQRLFASTGGAAFSISDLTEPAPGGPFDTVTLLDVYEHIPASERAAFHANLRMSMASKSRLIVTCPSFLHQSYLAENEPEGLQIIDETIGPEEFVELARALNGHLVHMHYESVWRTNDYVYAVIDTQMDYQWKPKLRGIERWSAKVNKFIDRTPLGGPAHRQRFIERRAA